MSDSQPVDQATTDHEQIAPPPIDRSTCDPDEVLAGPAGFVAHDLSYFRRELGTALRQHQDGLISGDLLRCHIEKLFTTLQLEAR